MNYSPEFYWIILTNSEYAVWIIPRVQQKRNAGKLALLNHPPSVLLANTKNDWSRLGEGEGGGGPINEENNI